MTFVKICSITNSDDALAAVDAGADYLGFIGVPNTPRFIAPAQFAAIAAALPPSTKRVIVVRDIADARDYDATIVQYYTGDPKSLPSGAKLLPVIRPRFPADLEAMLETVPESALAVLVDAYHSGKLGGAGVVTDWEIAAEAVRRSPLPVFLAGGLSVENVNKAIAAVGPYAVDVSSGVEARPGKKDHAKLRAFIAAAKTVR